MILSGGFVALISAYVIRFLTVAMQPVEAAYQGISKNLDEVSILTGKNNLQTFRLIHLPLLKTSLWTALLLVFVDLLKELPATLVLRPFNFNTLAVSRRRQCTAPGWLHRPVILLNHKINQSS